MSTIDTKDLEMLSAYLDGELTEKELAYIELKLQQSPTLRQELAALKSTKNAVQAIPPLPQDPYFETRLMQNLVVNRKSFSSVFSSRKPVIAFASVTLLFLIVFKVQPDLFQNIMETNREKMTAFYAKNLMPLISATNLTNDDILNFAFNKYLPINKENNRVLGFGNNSQGEQIIEVKSAEVAGLPLNLETFAKTYGLSSKQKQDVDKILERYTDKIAAAVLVNKKNSVAVNASLWGLHDQLRKDLLGYVSENNSAAFHKMMPEGGDELLKTSSGRTDSHASNYYYYISEDTVFASLLPVDMAAIDQTIKKIKYAETAYNYNGGEREAQQQEVMMQHHSISDDLKKVNIELKQVAKVARGGQSLANAVQVYADSGNCRVVIPHSVTGVKIDVRLNNIAKKLDSAFSSYKVYAYADANDERNPIPLPEPSFKRYGNPVQVNSGIPPMPEISAKPSLEDSLAKKFNLYFDKSGSYLKNKKKEKNSSSVIEIDSLQKLLRYYLGESKALRQNGDVDNSLEEVRKEIEQVWKQLEKLSREMQQKKQNRDTIIGTRHIMEL